MKHVWIRKNGARRLVVFFSGFACDADFLKEEDIPEGCDAVAFYDYRSLNFDIDVSAYPEIGVAAWSFGVWVADFFPKNCRGLTHAPLFAVLRIRLTQIWAYLQKFLTPH